MAIQFRILFTLGLLTFNASILSVPAQRFVVTDDLSETPLNFSQLTLNNPQRITIDNNERISPVFLHCQVETNIVTELRKDLIANQNFYTETIDEDDEEDDDKEDNNTVYSDAEVRKQYEEQSIKFNKHIFERNKSKQINVIHPVAQENAKNKFNSNTFGKNDDENDNDNDDDGGDEEEGPKVKMRHKRQSDYGDYEIEEPRVLIGDSGIPFGHGASAEVEISPEEVEDKELSVKVRQIYLDQSEKYKKNTKVKEEKSKKRFKRQTNETKIFYTFKWLRDDSIFISYDQTKKLSDRFIKNGDYVLFSNGTLKFKPTSQTKGIYRCKASISYQPSRKGASRFIIGPIRSNPTTVTGEDNEDDGKSTTVAERENVLIACSVAKGMIRETNIVWYFNNNVINFDKGKSDEYGRYHLLRNGSLLIMKTRMTDSGEYKCNVTNQFSPYNNNNKEKLQNSLTTLVVMSRNGNNDGNDDSNDNEGEGLISKLEKHSMYKIKAGGTLELYCVRNWRGEKITWKFQPRNSNGNDSTILNELSNNMKVNNVSLIAHDGIYSCGNGERNFVFDVTITSPPILLNNLKSVKSQLAVAPSFNCSASGNPAPEIEWYRNGELIKNGPIIYSNYPLLKFLSLEPTDEGSYQCFARNEYGEASATFYLHVQPRSIIRKPPNNLKCQATDNGDLRVAFEQDSAESYNAIQYLAAYGNDERDTGVEKDKISNRGVEISKSNFLSAKPLKPFHFYVRLMQISKMGGLLLSLLSEPAICAFQQIEPKFIKASNGSFLGWDIDVADEDISKTIITIQFLKNGTTDALSFSNEVVGSYEKIDDFKTWNDIEKSLQKISVNSSDHRTYTEIKVPGNVTGILIIKVDEVFVRIFGSIEVNGMHIEQDYENMKWKSLKSPYENITVTDIQSRSISITWNGLDSYECMKACTYLKQDVSLKFLREKFATKLNCEKILNPSAKSFYISKLSPTSDYDVFITDCKNNNDLSTRVNIQTLKDVPGPVANTSIGWDRGIVLKWDLPRNPNGKIYYYSIEWILHGETHNINVTDHEFRFPNTKITDRFNITVRAVGEGGIGNPLHTYPERWKNLLPLKAQSTKFNPLMIFVIIFLSILLLMLVVGLLWCKQNRYCKNTNNAILNSEQSSFSPASQCMDNNIMIRSDEMLEMQTLISNSSQNNISNSRANGKDIGNSIKSEIHVVPSIALPPTTNGSILRTSTPTEEHGKKNNPLDHPIKCDGQDEGEEEKNNDFIKTFHQPSDNNNTSAAPLISNLTPPTITKSPLKVNGNITPYKSLKSSGNDQNTSSSTSSTSTSSSSFSSGQLIEISPCNGVNHHNNNNNNHHYVDISSRSKVVGKSNSIETDNDEEDSEENINDYNLNDSNLSTKPLHSHSWNYRATTLVGPNG